MKTVSSIFTFALVLTGVFPAVAQEAAKAPQALVMSESEAIRAAVDASQELTRLDKRVKAKQVTVDYAKYDLPNPELRMQDLSTQYFKEGANHRFQIGLRWKLPTYGEVDETVALARWEYQDARVDAFLYRTKLVGEVRRAYFDVVALRDESELAARRESIEARRLDVVSKLVELGTVPFIRKVKAQTSLLKARRDTAGLRNALDAAKARLAALVGNEGRVDAETFELPEGEIGLGEVMRRAEASRPEVQLERDRTALATTGRRTEMLKMIPSFSFIEASFHHESKDTDWGELMFGIEIPVFNWGRGKLKAAELASESRESTRSAGLEAVKKDIGEAFREAVEARSGYLTLKGQTDETRANVRQTVDQARRQGVPEDEVLELELSDIDLDDMMLSARRGYAEALIDLCVAVGVEGFEDLSVE